MRTAADYRALWDAVLARHKWLVCTDVAAGFTPLMKTFSEVGAPKPLLLAGSEGTGPQPDPDDCELVILGTSGDTIMGGIRAFERALRELPSDVLDRIEAWDSEREAVVMTSFLDSALEIGGRPSWGSSPASWKRLEDKMIIDELWDAVGVPRAPRVLVEANAEALVSASREIDAGAGVVWTADNREGWHGGGEYSRYVADATDAYEQIEFMSDHADRVRVMPFLEGVPCAIHGMVFPDYVAVFRPVEMVVFRVPDSGRFRYGSCSSSWDPHPDHRDEMRSIAKHTGDHLRAHHDFRGAFTIDGVATAEGFRPTELNPRFGAGIGVLGKSADIPLLGLSRMLVQGEDEELDGEEIERLVLEASDASRTVGGLAPVTQTVTETEELRVRWSGSTVEPCDEDDANATLTRGPAAHGGIVRFNVDSEAAPSGPQAAPIVLEAFRLADQMWDTGIGDLIPATPA